MGDVWLNPMWEPHGWVVPERERSVSITFLPEFLGEEMLGELAWLTLFAVPPKQRPRVTDAIRARVVSLGEEMYAEVHASRPKWHVAVRLDLLRLFFLLGREWQPPEEALRRGSVRDSNIMRLMPALAMVQEVTPGRVAISAAAAACGMSLSRFCVVFKETMGVSFGQFALRARAASAAHLLLRTDLGVHEIAPKVGFTDASHLHHTFMNLYGCSPGAYRRRLRKANGPFVAGASDRPADSSRVYVRVSPMPE